MKEIVKINLDNEMDLILAHKRSMKIAEMCGMPSSLQTRFATAVSEVARCSIANGQNSELRLGINVVKNTNKEIVAILNDSVDLKKCNPEAFKYAAKLSGTIEYDAGEDYSVTQFSLKVPSPGLLSEAKIKSLADYFKYESPLSPYDEIRKKNIELIALSEKLGESENRYRQLANTIPILICIINERNHVLLTNESLQVIVKSSFTVFEKKELSLFIHPEDVDHILENWSRIKKNKTEYSGETRIKKGDSYRWFLISIIPNKTEDGNFTNWLVYFVDINDQKTVEETLKNNSELKLIQRELEHANSKLTFKNKELQQFAYIASHDLQEPLRKIRIMLSRAGEDLSEEQKNHFYFDKITSAAGRMSDLISDVLNYSRVDNNLQTFLPIDLNEILHETINDLSLIIEEKNAVINISPLPTVSGLNTQLRQLFFNLVNNALKFNSEEPVITIAADEESTEPIDAYKPEGNYHLITIADNGIGMDSNYSDRIFDMFQRLHQRDQYGGNGIGLALCKKIIENHNGVLNFTSELGKGTIFYIYLPKY
ncbi:sensor histidine kinase [Flavobacterium hungaricum]|uniref:histidine kinase n=1 Tax=Flavobacterium hungaricum TaxID=2082725 RepID=A0ABR9TMB6_9FLAO|nr:PAS domain-containing sensor histidine kinase [Flavobacterium hungaricum]MBE8725979.1 PAS domain-containing sensor histidine kinase [Flavobacterium hungaricum]